MPRPKAIGRALLTYPRTVDKGSYSALLRMTIAQSKSSALAATTKIEFDVAYAELIRRQYSHNEDICNRLIAESTTKASTRLYEELTAHLAKAILDKQATTSRFNRDIKLAEVGHDYRGHKSDETIVFQRYEDFARKTKMLNPEITFNKDVMDDAFRVAAARVSSKTKRNRSFRDAVVKQMLDRCLGEESEKYWKD